MQYREYWMLQKSLTTQEDMRLLVILIKQVAEVTEKLGDLQEKMKKLKEVPNSAPKNVTNALFVGSTAELQKMLKGKTENE